jgi:hypothetical protein
MTARWALATALLSLGVSIVSFGWQVVAWRFGRPVIKIRAGDYTITGRRESRTVITVSNVGGMPVTLTSAGFQRRRRRKSKLGGWVLIPDGQIASTLPHRLEPGSEALFVGSRSAIVEALQKAGRTSAHPWVLIAGGKTKVGKRYTPSLQKES